MKIELLVSRYPRMIGLARYTTSIQKYLTRLGVEYSCIEPSYPFPLRTAHGALKPLGYDVKTFFNIYPVAAPLSRKAVKHFTTQMMAFMFSFDKDLRTVVVTVHDIVPYLTRNKSGQNNYPRLFDRFVDEHAMKNLYKADRIIAISNFTKKTLVEKLSCPSDKIIVISQGLDHDIFRLTTVSDEFRSRLNLDPTYSNLLFVGSDNPRKNLPGLIKAFAYIKTENPRVRLIKVGASEQPSYERQLRNIVRELKLEDSIFFYGNLPEDDLVNLYNAVDLFVFPSFMEGFGLPVLEAMACGAPVICSNTASLPEVAGDAAILVDPDDIDALAGAMLEVLGDKDLADDLRSRGLARAKEFTWERTAHETLSVYRQVWGDG